MSDQETPQNNELAAFGEELRREREIRGISLKEIADATKISRRFLEAIERNDHKTLPAPVFTRGFVREYARYLGLNAEEIVTRYNYAAAGDDRIEKSAHLSGLVTERVPEERKDTRPRGIPTPLARIDRGVYVLLLLAVALAVAITWAVKHRRAAGAVDTAESQHEAPVRPAAVAVVPPPATASSVPPPVNDSTLRLTLNFVDASWIMLEVDRQTISFDAEKGEKKSFEAKDHFRFKTIGNAGGMEMTLNDVHIPPLGREGQVLHDRIFDRDYLQKARAAGTTATQP
jgi:cytoskeletal protein RodZ